MNALMNRLTQQNASASEELAATAEEMSGHAERLQHLMAFFRVAAESSGAARRQPARESAVTGKSRPRAAAPADGGFEEAEFVRF